MKIRRSINWCMGNNPQELESRLRDQIEHIPCDGICVDLEDGVMSSKKEEMRHAAAGLLRQLDFHGKEKIVRINEPNTHFYQEDLKVILPVIPDALRIPKCEHVEPLLDLDRQISEFEQANGLRRNTIELILVVETPIGIRNTYNLAACSERVTAVGIGMEDLTSEMNMQRYYDNAFSDDLIYARQKFVLDVKAAKKQAIDSVSWWPSPEDTYMKYQEDYANRSYRMGYDGKSCRDIRDVEIANKAYAPTQEQVAWGRAAVAEYDDAVREGREPNVNGKNICTARYNKAKWLVEYAAQLQAKAMGKI